MTKKKIIVTNIVVALAVICGSFGIDVDPEAQAAIVGGVMAILNLIIAVSVKLKGQ